MRSILYFLITAAMIWTVQTYGGDVFGIKISGENTFLSALIFSVIFSVVNLLIGTVLRLLTFPITWLTFGLFAFVVTVGMVWITDQFYDNLTITNWMGYLILAVIPTMTSSLLRSMK